MIYNFSFHNEWLQKYFELCNQTEAEVGENHHIYPTCIFGKNDITIKLSVLNHMKAHWLLYKAYKADPHRNKKHFQKICYSLSSFNQVNDTRRKRFQLLDEQQFLEYQMLCAEAREANSEASRGDLNPQKRPEVREKISLKKRGNKTGPRSIEAIEKSRKTAIENGSQKELVSVYHVITGEICKVHYSIATILHENWKIGRKFKPKDDTLYWHPDYLALKDSLRSRQSLTGVKKTKQHMDKINKNPEKIRKQAEKHLGSTRSEEQKKRMSETRKRNIKENGGPSNKGQQIFYNPDNINETLQCYPELCPTGWVRGNPKTRKNKNATKVN